MTAGQQVMGVAAIALTGCGTVVAEDIRPDYGPVTASFLADDLLQVTAEMGRAGSVAALYAYADCAAAEAMALKNLNFARHVRTLTEEEGGKRRADAIYTVSAERPQGDAVLEADAVKTACAAQGIPGV